MNRVTLIGNIGKEPEFRSTNNGKEVCTFSMATKRSWKNDKGEWINETDWHKIVLWSPTDYQKKQLKSGNEVFVEGSSRTRMYEDKDKVKHSITEIVCDKFQGFLKDKSGKPNNQTNDEISSNNKQVDDDLPF